MIDNCGLLNNRYSRRDESSNHLPSTTPKSTRLTPINEASPTRPGRSLFIHKPVIRAAGMVTTMANTPQGLSLRALTTAMPDPAKVAMTTNSVATRVIVPETGPSSLAAIFGSDSPSCRTEASRTTKSWTPPARQAPTTIQVNPGRYPHCAAKTGPNNGPAPAMAAKWAPKSTNRRVGR